MDLFDARVRSDLGPAEHGESHWSYLDRSARPEWDRAREQPTDWLGRLCQPKQAELCTGLRSGDDQKFVAALWELYLHELFVRLDYEVECEAPLPNGRNIDFLVSKGGQSMYVEATIARSSGPGLKADARRDRIYRELQKTRTESFMFGIEIKRAGDTDMRGVGSLRRELEEWLAGLDPDDVEEIDVASGVLPTYDWTEQDWVLQFEAFPVRRELRNGPISRPLGMFMDETGGAIDDETRLHRALGRKKASKYGELEHPYVVAIAEYGWEVGDLAWHRANVLYGTSAVQFGADRVTRSIRQNDGHWRGPGGRARNRRLAAVLFASRLLPWLLDDVDLEWWDNPFAADPVVNELVPEVARTQRLVISNGSGSLVVHEP